MTLSTFFGKNHGFLIRSSLVVDVAGNAIDPVTCMFRFDPRLEETGRPLLVAGDAEPYINLFYFGGGGGTPSE
jgi:hypothetical protein